MQTETTQRKLTVVGRQRPRPAVRVHPGGLDRLAVAQGRRDAQRRQVPARLADRGELRGDLLEPGLPAGAVQLDRHLPDRDLHRDRVRDDGRLRHRAPDFPGKAAIVAVSLLISMFPQIALVTPLFKIETTHRAVRHLARPDHPLHHLRAAAGHLHALGVLPGDPVGPGEGGQDGRRHALPGVPPGDHPAGHAGRVHHGHPGLHLLLERLPVRALADLDVERRAPCRRR